MNDSLWSAVDEEARQRMIKTNGVDLCTQALGDPVDPGMLLILGATASMVPWPETLRRHLADSGLCHPIWQAGHRSLDQLCPLWSQAIGRARTLRLLD
jgi:hypothetical protein